MTRGDEWRCMPNLERLKTLYAYAGCLGNVYIYDIYIYII
jgi:hypothetical protein